MSPEEVTALQVRVGNGLEWLSEHDPKGHFYVWWQAGLTPATLMPAQPPAVIDEWKAWYNAKLVWDRLDKKLAYEEKRGHAPLPWAVPWVPPQAARP